ncbi:alcohol dehydrogenase catalytic domain-containing protein [Lentilactobacillus sunkii]|nr:alcohol dehydrogenase catalytic domain-containing protein [Lentilactobacillus sunkii]
MFVKPGKVEIKDIDKPTIQAEDDVILHIVRACVCGSDLWAYRGLEDKEPNSENSGHEAIAIVDQVGEKITTVQSGKYTRQDHINKRGNPKARMIMYLIVQNMIRAQHVAPNHIVDYYYKLKNGPIPKKNKVAIVACMNKTLYCLFSMVQANQKYDYTYHGLVVQ